MNIWCSSVLLMLGLLCSSCVAQDTKINGVSFVGTSKAIEASSITPILQLHANYVAVMPFGFIKDLQTPHVTFNGAKQWWGEREEGVRATIVFLQAQNLNVMLKPHMWVWGGEFTGHISMHSEGDWKTLETSYETYILRYAQLAQDRNVSLFCIGTELHTFVQQRPKFWEQLIAKIRTVYQGKLTYAENWDQFEKVSFWKKLDYIGIDAYFPLSGLKTPTVTSIEEGWKPYKKNMEALYDRERIPIVFTEYGYRSVPFTAKTPWNSAHSSQVDLTGQANALEGLFQTFWKEPWFAGGFLWKWFPDHDNVGGMHDNRFTVQRKPAAAVVRSVYKQE